ncbi:hypothetical protein EBT31_23175 [bacterium]|jgi:hypothetical protein|nr:hypothetical protein [bacterium]
MAMQTDVKGVSCPASTDTTAYNGRTRLKGLYYSASAASSVAVKDGATTLFTFTIAAADSSYVILPGEGAVVQTSLVITVGANCTAVAFYG